TGAAPRLLTVATKDTDILRLPWELLTDARGPLTRQGVTIRRQLEESARESIAYPFGLPLRLLLVVSRPDDLGFIDPRLTTRAMFDALEPLGDGRRPSCGCRRCCRPPSAAASRTTSSTSTGMVSSCPTSSWAPSVSRRA